MYKTTTITITKTDNGGNIETKITDSDNIDSLEALTMLHTATQKYAKHIYESVGHDHIPLDKEMD